MSDMTATAPADEPEGGAMTDSELAQLLAQHESRAVGYYNSEIADDQAKAIDYYYGRPFGDEQAGRSQVVERTVAITVDNALAALLKPFVSSDDTVSFGPRQKEDIEFAEQATEYVNYVFNCDNPGFLILHDWFKDALLTKIGVVKWWWEDTTRTVETEHQGVPATDLEMLRQHEGYQGEQEIGDGLYNVTTAAPDEDGRVKVQVIPPEEFLISPFSRSIEEAPYVAHRPANTTRSALIEMGFDPEVVETLSAFAQGRDEESRSQSRYQDEEWSTTNREVSGNDKSQDIIGIIDEFVRVDYDGDGVSELRRVIRVDDTILLNEVADEKPFALLCPVPMSHKVYGLSLADQTMDLQRIQSVVTRQTLDNLYLANNPRPELPEGAERSDGSTLDDLMDNSPGAIIRTKTGGMLNVFAIPFFADKSFTMLDWLDQQIEARTGISKAGQGLDTNALKKSGMTATEMAMIEGGKNARVEMIARIFAETGVKRLFQGLLNLVTKHQPKARTIRLRNQWVEVDPRGWPEMDVTISVGLGVGNKMERMAEADGILETMKGLQDTPFAYMVGPEQAHKALANKFRTAGIKNVDDYLLDPKENEPPAPQPDPETMKVQAEMQAKQAEMQLKAQSQQADMAMKQEEGAMKLQLSREEASAKLELEQARAATEAQLAMAQFEFEKEMAVQKFQFESQLAEKQAERSHEAAMESAKMKANRPGGDLSK